MQKSTILGAGAEFDMIRRFLRDADSSPSNAAVQKALAHVVVPPGDDAAVIRDGPFALSVDLSLEDVHFRRDWLAPEEIGYRACAAALSDLAAMAAEPVGILIALAVRDEDRNDFAPRVNAGARAAAIGFGATVLGGDLTRSLDRLAIDIVVIGRVLRPVLRSGAQPGDTVWVTGELGAAAAAVACLLRGETPEPAVRLAFSLPAPRIPEALWLAERDLPRALIDLSDGLAGDADHIAAASGVSIIIDDDAVPIHPAARAAVDSQDGALHLALAGGEDYELAFTARPGAVEPHVEAFERAFGIRLTRVGSVERGSGVHLRRSDGSVRPMPFRGFDHFAAHGS